MKLKKDISKYENAGVPHEKMGFWHKVDEVFSKLDIVAILSDEVHPLNALLSREHFTNTNGDLSQQIPMSITAALEKDQNPLPEVCSKHLSHVYLMCPILEGRRVIGTMFKFSLDMYSN